MRRRGLSVAILSGVLCGFLSVAADAEDPDPAYPPGWQPPLSSTSEDFFEDGIFLGPFIDELTATFGDRLGPVRIDRSVSPAVLRVQVSSHTASDEATFASMTASNPRTKLGAAKYTQAQLDTFVSRIDEILDAHGVRQLGTVDNGDGTLTLRLQTPLDAATDQELRSEMPADVLVVRILPDMELRTEHEARDVFPPHEGAMAIAVVEPPHRPYASSDDDFYLCDSAGRAELFRRILRHGELRLGRLGHQGRSYSGALWTGK